MTFGKFGLISALLSMFAALFFLPATNTALAEEAVAEVDGAEMFSAEEALAAWKGGETLKLLAPLAVDETVVIGVEEEKTLELNGQTLSFAGEEGSVLSVQGKLSIVGDGEISGGNSSSGGVYVSGGLTLKGGVHIEDNHGKNVFLSNGNTIDASEFTGRVGISVLSGSAANLPLDIVNGEESGEFFSDDLSYSVEWLNGKYRLVIAPLSSVEAQYEGEETVYPSTPLDALKAGLSVNALNENGVPYLGRYSYEISGNLEIGESELSVTVTGENGEQATARFSVTVEEPVLRSVSARFEQQTKVYFDTPLGDLARELTVTGQYSDGVSHELPFEETSVDWVNGLSARYSLSGDLNVRVNGFATVTVHAGEFSATFTVEISRHVLNADDLTVRPVTVVGPDAARQVSPDRFVVLPSGIRAIPSIAGKPLTDCALEVGVYPVDLSFEVVDQENYEIAGTRTTMLYINRERLTALKGDSVVCVVEREGGAPSAWSLSAEDVTGQIAVDPEWDYDVAQAYEVTLFRGDSAEEVGTLTVRLLLDADLADEEVRLFRLLKSGETEEIAARREGEYLVFETDTLLESQFVVAVDSNFGVYLALTIVFGVLCVAGAGLLLWYFVCKRKLKLR